jgi:hypothetical protein
MIRFKIENIKLFSLYQVISMVLLVPFYFNLGLYLFIGISITLSLIGFIVNKIFIDHNHKINRKPVKVKVKKYYCIDYQLGTVYEQDENGNITKFENRQIY